MAQVIMSRPLRRLLRAAAAAAVCLWSCLAWLSSFEPSSSLAMAATAAPPTRAPMPGRVAVVGATGGLGREVVAALLAKGVLEVRALVRDLKKGEEAFDGLSARSRLELYRCDATDAEAVKRACAGADAAIWCVSGGAGGNPLQQAWAMAELALGLPPPDERGLAALGEHFQTSAQRGPPQVLMVSSAAVTRPSWSEAKKEQLSGCADIPIVRLNPFGILGKKKKTEDRLRESGARYAIVRPVGLKDTWGPGRPILTQGDVAVGRISRKDLAWTLTELLQEPEASGKTFEVLTVEGYPRPAEFGRVLQSFQRDDQGPLSEDEVAATYKLLQQLLPGEKQDAAALAMGQTYEQYDAGAEGRLGPRGKERVPERVA